MVCGVMRVEKRGRGAVYGLQIEANRKGEDHARHGREFDRSDIDWALTDTNVSVIRTENWNKEITRQIREAGVKERKGSVVLLDGLYTASGSWFDEHSTDEMMDYFRDCLAFHVREYCGGDASRVINAVVHLDETTPHLQIASVPIVEDEKGAHLSAKVIMGNRPDYRIRQDRFFEQVTRQRGMERGEVRDDAERRRHTTKREWQLATQKERLASATAEADRMEAHMKKFSGSADELEALRGTHEDPVFGREHYRLDPHTYRRLRTLAKVGIEREAECARLADENASFRSREQSMQETERQLREQLSEAFRRTAALEDDLNDMQETATAFFPDFETVRSRTSQIRSMERAYSRRSQSSPHRIRIDGKYGKWMPTEEFLLSYIAECKSKGIMPAEGMARASLVGAAAVATAVRLRQQKKHARSAGEAVRRTAEDMGHVLSCVGIPENRHADFCRACGDEMDRQLVGGSPRPLPGAGFSVSMRDAVERGMESVEELAGPAHLPPAVLPSICDLMPSMRDWSLMSEAAREVERKKAMWQNDI